MAKIPKILHYCFGLTEDFGGKSWGLIHHVCLKSALERIQPEAVFLYYEYEPLGPWWELSRSLVTPVKITAPREVFGRPLSHPAHRADVVRLRQLIETGGIYLDADVLVHRDFDDLLDHSTVLGEEGVGTTAGVANAVILAEPNAPFVRRWYEEYRWFRSAGDDTFWNEHSVCLPKRLANEHPGEVTVLPYTAFYWPLWTPHHLNWIFATDTPVQTSPYANHLWEARAWPYVEDLTPRDVRNIDTNFNRWARPFLTDVPDLYGAKSGPIRLYRGLRKKAGAAKHALGRFLRDGRRRPALQGSTTPTSDERQKIFQEIYTRRLWGSEEGGQFFSGIGSRGHAAEFYAEQMAALIDGHQRDLGRPVRIVDLGCGDFEVGRALLARIPDATYAGCDIVPELVAYLNRVNASDRARFITIDIVADPLPQGDVCLIRQVLQHLPNADIRRVLSKLDYPFVYVTEGQPRLRVGPVNPDKSVNFDMRFNWRIGQGRGVELAEPPFDMLATEVFRADVSDAEIVITERVEVRSHR